MGLVNLRSSKILVFSVSSSLNIEIKEVLENNKYKNVQIAENVPLVLQKLKDTKFDILISDINIGDTKIEDFLLAIKKAYPRVAPVIVKTQGKSLPSELIYSEVDYPIRLEVLIPILENVMMEKMGIAVSSVAIEE